LLHNVKQDSVGIKVRRVSQSCQDISAGASWMLSVPLWCRAQILTKSITAAVLNAIGDLIAQFAVEKKDKLDVGRFVRFAALVSICRAYKTVTTPNCDTEAPHACIMGSTATAKWAFKHCNVHMRQAFCHTACADLSVCLCRAS
jgi:hypothetical protein